MSTTVRPELGVAQWRKSTYSDGNGGACLEVADNFPGIVPVRDSKVPDGPVLMLGSAAWTEFVAEIKVDWFAA
ncbi:DUF397 domain-containing protein [Streptomyces sp. NPDC003077]|uniref:DUF397 domain-containing protein n=1 Tax=Streptomyces sp. NPDC003077 TaxID=3154443 RepID=UPI0033AA5E3C